MVLCSACVDYFFTEPLYTFEISSEDLPYFFLFTALAAITAWFVAVRRRIENDLRDTRDHLQVEVEQRKHREDEIRKLNQELVKRATELETSNNELESLPIPSPTTFARRFAMWSGIRRCCRGRRLPSSTRRVAGSYKQFSNQQKEWVT